MTRRTLLSLPLASLPLVAIVVGCSGHGPAVGFSEPVPITFTGIKPNAVVNGGLLVSKNVNTGGSNPWGKFVADAQANLGGMNPTEVDLTGATLAVGSGSTPTGVTLDQIFSNQVPVNVTIGMSGPPNNVYELGQVSVATGAGPGPLVMSAPFKSTQMTASDYQGLLAGQFKVSVEGSAAASFTGGGFNVSLTTTFTFVAYQ